VESRASGVNPGDVVLSMNGWRERFVAPSKELTVVDRRVTPLSAYLGVLGVTGMTAWVGLRLVDTKAGDRVFVSGAAGAVGGMAGQIAKARGHRVIGSAGSPEKVAHLTDELGFDAALNYRDGDVRGQLAAAAPDGIDVYFDNVGGEHLEAALDVLNRNGRVAMCGAISQYNATEPVPGPRNLGNAVGKRLTLRGFIVSDHGDRMRAFAEEVGGLLRAGQIKHRETVVEGLEHAPEAFIGLLRGENTGKMLVRLA
jgi:NADPH-dependent curcumin reductase CurA